MQSNDNYMNEAIRLAKIAYKNGDVPVGVVIVDQQGKIIGEGYNTKEMNNNPLEHAEMIAIAQACKAIGQWRLNECTLYSTLEPCLMCTGAILHSRIKTIFFSLSDPKFGAIVSNNRILEENSFNHKIEFHQGILREKVKTMMQQFFKNVRKKDNLQ